MRHNIIKNLKERRRKLEDIKNNSIEEIKSIPTITITRENNIDKVEISDYMLVGDYVKTMEKQGEYALLDEICNSVLWNNSKQKINKGTYYVITIGNRTYNILINSDKIRISVRTKIKLDTTLAKENITLENILHYNINTNSYGFSIFKHDKIGSTFFHKYYNKNKTFDLGELELTKEEACEKIEEFITLLEVCNETNNVLNIDLLKTNILEDLKNELNQAKKILPN